VPFAWEREGENAGVPGVGEGEADLAPSVRGGEIVVVVAVVVAVGVAAHIAVVEAAVVVARVLLTDQGIVAGGEKIAGIVVPVRVDQR